MSRSTSKAALARTLAALDDRGLMAASITIKPGGEVEIIPAPKTLTGPAGPVVVNDLDRWREKRNGRRAFEGS